MGARDGPGQLAAQPVEDRPQTPPESVECGARRLGEPLLKAQQDGGHQLAAPQHRQCREQHARLVRAPIDRAIVAEQRESGAFRQQALHLLRVGPEEFRRQQRGFAYRR